MQRRAKYLVIGAVVVVLAAAGAGATWFLSGDAPAEVDLSVAAGGVRATADAGADSSPETSPDRAMDGSVAALAESVDLTGTWTVDRDTGKWDFESATGTFVGFRVKEELARIGSAEAVGRTGAVTGSLEIEGTTIVAASFEVDMRTITTDESLRDRKVQEALETDQFPTASFTLTEPIELDRAAVSGEPTSVAATGELTVHGVTHEVEISIDAQLVEGTVVAVGSLELQFSDYSVEVPSSPIVLSAEDHGILELQLLFVRG